MGSNPGINPKTSKWIGFHCFWVGIRLFNVLVVTDKIQDLLILQDRDATVHQLKVEIERLPKEVEKLEQKIAEEKASADDAKNAVQELERKRKELELEAESAEEQIGKYKTQQLQVKKNEEYRALTHQIEELESKISDLETDELEIMEQTDAALETLKEVEADVTKRVKYQEELIGECQAKLTNLKGRLGEAESAYSDQTAKMDPADVQLFEVLKTQIKRSPYIAEMSGQNCGGCHMRVSNDVSKQAKIGEMVRCDQCSRVVYVDR